MIYHAINQLPEDDYPIEEWRIIEHGHHADLLGQLESVFSLSNGYLGIRGSYDEVRPALESLADDGWSQVIVSNHVPELEEIVRDLGLRRYFTRVLSSALVGFEKPNPEIFRRALQLTLPGRPVWMIGDSERADCLPAHDLGIQAILVRAASSDFTLQAGDVLEAANIVRSGASS